jgi:hypothetical protein
MLSDNDRGVQFKNLLSGLGVSLPQFYPRHTFYSIITT